MQWRPTVQSGWSSAPTRPRPCLTAGPLARCSVEGRELLAIQLSGKQSGRHHQKVKVKVRLLGVCACLPLAVNMPQENLQHQPWLFRHTQPGWQFTHWLYYVTTLLQLVGGIHGNEQACPEVLLRLVHHLAGLYGRSRRITHLLDATDIHILPVSKPQPASWPSAILSTNSTVGHHMHATHTECCSALLPSISVKRARVGIVNDAPYSPACVHIGWPVTMVYCGHHLNCGWPSQWLHVKSPWQCVQTNPMCYPGQAAHALVPLLLLVLLLLLLLPVNPDGREADTRFNARGKDLNRNFPLDPLPFCEYAHHCTSFL